MAQQTVQSSSSSSSSATTARTSINGKFYPLKLRPWTEFPELHKHTFARILEADRGRLPSQETVQHEEKSLLRRLPRLLQPISGFRDETRTAQYIDIAWESPASYIVQHFLDAQEAGLKIYFSNDLKVRESVSSGSTVPMTPASEASAASAANAANAASVRLEGNSFASTETSSAPPTMTHNVSPDCVVLALSDLPAGLVDSSHTQERRRIMAGEHKPFHALRADVAAKAFDVPLPETYMVRLAHEARVRLARSSANKRRGRQSEQRQMQAGFVQESFAESTYAKDPEIVESTRSLEDKDRNEVRHRQSYFAYALTQTYHYMLVSGMAYGYIATGETLTVLHIPEDDPTCLLYHASVFPAPTLSEAAALPDLVTAAPPLTGNDPIDTDAILRLPVSRLSSLCVLAYETDNTIRDPRWTAYALQRLVPFPQKPRSGNTVDLRSSLGRRRRDDDDDDDNDNDSGNGDGSDNGSGGDSGDESGSDRSRRRTLQPQSTGSLRGRNKARVPSPLKHTLSAQGHARNTLGCGTDFSQQDAHDAGCYIRKPTLPYCTQGCLRSLTQDGPLDPRCPNVALHAGGQTLRGDARDEPVVGKHPITAHKLQELIRQQLLRAPEYDAECLYGAGFGGAIGHLFKLSATGYGYTFVAKAVQRQHRRRLRHEARIYAEMQVHQGRLIPVCLGLIGLAAPYPLQEHFRVVTHMLLLSYSGVSVWKVHKQYEEAAAAAAAAAAVTEAQLAKGGPSSNKPQPQPHPHPQQLPLPLPWGDRDIDTETRKILSTLQSSGLVENDNNCANVLWCDENKRVMKIDFDRAGFMPRRATREAAAPRAPQDALKRKADAKETGDGQDDDDDDDGVSGLLPAQDAKKTRHNEKPAIADADMGVSQLGSHDGC
ncbi:MAG: hypothetical protein STHCBS139747_005177 [Sporothrix thermara]